jgi:hypothetical protein
VFWVISVYFNIRNTLLKYGRFLLGHSVYRQIFVMIGSGNPVILTALQQQFERLNIGTTDYRD